MIDAEDAQAFAQLLLLVLELGDARLELGDEGERLVALDVGGEGTARAELAHDVVHTLLELVRLLQELGLEAVLELLEHLFGVHQRLLVRQPRARQDLQHGRRLLGHGHLVLLQHVELLVERQELVLDRLNRVLQRLEQFVARVQVVVRLGRHEHALRVLLEVLDELDERLARQLEQQRRELVLPLLAVREQRELERRAVQQDELNRLHRLLILNVVLHFGVSVKQTIGRLLENRFYHLVHLKM